MHPTPARFQPIERSIVSSGLIARHLFSSSIGETSGKFRMNLESELLDSDSVPDSAQPNQESWIHLFALALETKESPFQFDWTFHIPQSLSLDHQEQTS